MTKAGDMENDKEWIDPYGSVLLKLITIIVYIIEVISASVMFAFVAYETEGYAGHYRTFINQLLSYLYGGVRSQNMPMINLLTFIKITLVRP